jgi:hypothetical protein
MHRCPKLNNGGNCREAKDGNQKKNPGGDKAPHEDRGWPLEVICRNPEECQGRRPKRFKARSNWNRFSHSGEPKSPKEAEHMFVQLGSMSHPSGTMET